MTALRRHVAAVVAALLAMAVGIALGGGPLSYVPPRDEPAPSTAPGGGVLPDPPAGADELSESLADAAAERVYNKALFGHPTAIVVMPGASPEVQEKMVTEVGRAGGGLTGVFTVDAQVTDSGGSALVESLGSQLMTQLDDSRIDPGAPTYQRFGQLIGLAVATPSKSGQRALDASLTTREALSAGGLLTSDPEARLAPLVLVLLPDSAALDDETRLATISIYTALLQGLANSAVAVVALGDTGSASDGLLASLRTDPAVTGRVSTVGGGETAVGRVVAMMALIAGLTGSPGSYGASGAEGLPPVP